jgi:hypothetical protein
MKPRISLVAFAISVCGLYVLSTASPVRAQAFLQRLDAQYSKFDGTEFYASSSDTISADNGISIFTDDVKVPGSVNVLYITLSGTGDLNGTGVKGFFTCLVDGEFCNGGQTFAAGTGWISLQGGSDTTHDNAVNYTWCTPIAKNQGAKGKERLMHTIELRMATNGAGSSFIEGMHVFIDANKIQDPAKACAATQ